MFYRALHSDQIALLEIAPLENKFDLITFCLYVCLYCLSSYECLSAWLGMVISSSASELDAKMLFNHFSLSFHSWI